MVNADTSLAKQYLEMAMKSVNLASEPALVFALVGIGQALLLINASLDISISEDSMEGPGSNE